MAKLLKEYYTLQPDDQVIKEFKENSPDKPLYVTGIIQRADAENQNKRIYPFSILKRECDRYKNEVINGRQGFGELDHTDQPVIQYKHVSHVLEDLWWDGPEKKEVWGKIRILNTPSGQIARSIIRDGFPLGISSRAVGSVSKNESRGVDIVGEDLHLICFDLVCTPSTHNAFLNLQEAKDISNFDPNKILPPELRIKETLTELLKKR